MSRADLDIRFIGTGLRLAWNSQIPFTLNDGALWAGRGQNISLSGGVESKIQHRHGSATLTVAPALLYSENLPFQIRPNGTAGRSVYASPFHAPPFSADVPLRFGDRHLLRIDPGNSALTIRNSHIETGVTARSEVWGPALRNPLVLSANAAGIPRVFVGTPRPMVSALGLTQARFFFGALSESGFFDFTAGNDLRSISAALVELKPAFDTTLSIGVERVVYRPIGEFAGPLSAVLSRSLDAFFQWEAAVPVDDESKRQRADQIVAVYARWLVPRSGFEVYGEWARQDLPRSFRELFTALHHSLGYTVGAQWAQPQRQRQYVRIQAEFTNLEQSRVLPSNPPTDFYVGRASTHGYTNRGQIIGAAIGPGASSQWFAGDWIAPRWQLGWYVGRIRWENDAMYREPIPHLFLHDVTVFTGLRGARRTPWTDISVDATFGYRFNYLFQNGIPQPSGYGFRTVDVRNLTLSLAVTPR